MHVARHVGDGEYRVLASGQRVWVHPSSVLAQSRADAICFVELVRTTKTYARGVSVVQVDWLAELVPHYFARRQAVEQEGVPGGELAGA
ncbi:hypothetical protein H632_c965p2 [Helicosporidium sp. ATCC 50920]|nr:hypothetical protein H632_c965p2 [Helicosporidium sp. ATCC 50920]|eukprot:KDD74955.1 hypothetical protein H632_c965p2 [Helicosporidium sp. ATCC 50920]